MLVECMVIVGIICAVIIMSYVNGKKDAAIEMLPLIYVPCMYVIANYISIPLEHILPMNRFAVFTGLVIVSAVIAALFIGFFANRFKRKSTKAVYSIMSITFVFVLTGILVYNLFDLFY